MICEYVYDDGAYVLGALAPAERAAYERHLAGCPACREAVAEIAVLPGLLGRLDAAGLAQITPPPTAGSRLPALLGAARRERRQQRRAKRWRTAGTVLAAACLALVVGLGGAWLFDGGSPVPGVDPGVRLVAMQSVRGAAAPVTAEIGLAGTDWGTKVTMRCHYQRAAGYAKAYTFRLVAHGPDGAIEQVGSWVAGPGEDVTFTGATRFTAAELVRLELTRQDGATLLAYDVP
jgi:predicted anti-sigma-YlaC factor YlaD